MSGAAHAQNSAPTPSETVEGWATLPTGRSWGAETRLVKPWETLADTTTPDGTTLTLTRHPSEFVILADGRPLMSSRMHGSEEAMAEFACRQARTLERPCVLVGGLGMGFTLRATLDLLPATAVVVLAELVPSVVDWNRGPLGPLAGHPLKDGRVRIALGDVAMTLRSSPRRFDAILLDVDNGPSALTESGNARLYDNQGVAAARAALAPDGMLAVWSAWEDRKFEQRLRHAGFAVKVERVRGRLKKGGPHHAIFLAHRPASGAAE